MRSETSDDEPLLEVETEVQCMHRPPLTYAEVSELFHLPLPAASKHLKLGITQLKLACRRLGIARWPYKRPKRSEVRKKRRVRQNEQKASASPSGSSSDEANVAQLRSLDGGQSAFKIVHAQANTLHSPAPVFTPTLSRESSFPPLSSLYSATSATSLASRPSSISTMASPARHYSAPSSSYVFQAPNPRYERYFAQPVISQMEMDFLQDRFRQFAWIAATRQYVLP